MAKKLMNMLLSIIGDAIALAVVGGICYLILDSTIFWMFE